MSQFGEPWKDGKFKVSARISGGEDDETDLEMRADDGQKFTIGTIDDEYAARVIACLNACYGIPTEVLENNQIVLSNASPSGLKLLGWKTAWLRPLSPQTPDMVHFPIPGLKSGNFVKWDYSEPPNPPESKE
jgi:hypothetical protein